MTKHLQLQAVLVLCVVWALVRVFLPLNKAQETLIYVYFFHTSPIRISILRSAYCHVGLLHFIWNHPATHRLAFYARDQMSFASTSSPSSSHPSLSSVVFEVVLGSSSLSSNSFLCRNPCRLHNRRKYFNKSSSIHRHYTVFSTSGNESLGLNKRRLVIPQDQQRARHAQSTDGGDILCMNWNVKRSASILDTALAHGPFG